jgi:ribosomal protein S18 acetylase RimI-like enzyme
MLLRAATAEDIPAIVALHVDNWRRHYAGALSDDYLRVHADANRLERWQSRLGGAPPSPAATTVAFDDDGRFIGFVHTIFDEDDHDGSLLDNLHVVADLARTGVGTQLMAASARAVLDHHGATSGLYLEVLTQNVNAQAFYDARGGVNAGTHIWHAPDGNDIPVFRYVWPDPAALI